MHIIQRERGLAHWRALNSLTDERLVRLQARFAPERGAGGIYFPGGHAGQSSESLGEIATLLAEIFGARRERPLATVTETSG